MSSVVMIITPKDPLRRALEKLLQRGGFSFVVSAKGLDEIQHVINASNSQPDVILLDYWLPRYKTMRLVNSFKKQGYEVILLGNASVGQDIASSLEIPFLCKPFTKTELFTTITDIISNKKK